MKEIGSVVGEIIAVGFFGSFVALVVLGGAYEVRVWWEDRQALKRAAVFELQHLARQDAELAEQEAEIARERPGVQRGDRELQAGSEGGEVSDQLWPGDVIEAENGMKFRIERLVAVIGGGPDCKDPGCTRRYGPEDPPEGTCMSYHCSLCGEPCSMVGHDCELTRQVEW